MKTIRSDRLGECYHIIEHPSGLTMLLYPMEGFNSSYALFATRYGSIDTRFKLAGEQDILSVPEGIAHFLEHKLFESEEGDVFSRFAAIGASANAYTSFDRTAYLFSATQNFAEAIDTLLDFVTTPYFTKETVEKEYGIIGQEIRMYDDVADWRVFFNLLGSLYPNHPVRIDIAGTQESIRKIDEKLLYRCYNTFYNLHNMVLVVAGNFKIEDVMKAADTRLKTASSQEIILCDEPDDGSMGKLYTEYHLPIGAPIFNLGFKGISSSLYENTLHQVDDEIIIELLAGDTTEFYRQLYDNGILNSTFGGEVFNGRNYISLLFSGESRDPETVRDRLCSELEHALRCGFSQQQFDRCKKAVYSRYAGIYGRVEPVAGVLLSSYFGRCGGYELLERAAGITLDDIDKRLHYAYNPERCALSVVKAG